MTLTASEPTRLFATNPPNNLIQSIPFSELQKVYEQQERKGYIIESLIPPDSVNILAGDSGIGKSPLLYQAALCVANGLPFLGYATQAGAALYVDLENGVFKSSQLNKALVEHLGLPASHSDPMWCHAETDGLRDVMKIHRPAFVIIDSLRSFAPSAPETNKESAQFINDLRSLAGEYHAAFLVLHHLKKPADQNGIASHPALSEAESVIEWLNQASGGRALINHSDVRWGIDSMPGKPDLIVMRGYERVHGELGPIYVTRSCDETGEPLGYDRASGIDLLAKDEDRGLFRRLPDVFPFKEAVKASGNMHPQKVARKLDHYISVGLLHPHKPREPYRKVGGSR